MMNFWAFFNVLEEVSRFNPVGFNHDANCRAKMKSKDEAILAIYLKTSSNLISRKNFGAKP